MRGQRCVCGELGQLISKMTSARVAHAAHHARILREIAASYLSGRRARFVVAATLLGVAYARDVHVGRRDAEASRRFGGGGLERVGVGARRSAGRSARGVRACARRCVPRGYEEVVGEAVEVDTNLGRAIPCLNQRHHAALRAAADGARHVEGGRRRAAARQNEDGEGRKLRIHRVDARLTPRCGGVRRRRLWRGRECDTHTVATCGVSGWWRVWWKVRRRRQQGAESESGAARLEHARLGGAVDPDALQVLLRRRGLRRRNRRAHVEQQPLCALELRQQPPQASRAGSGRHARLHGLLLGASRRTLLAVRTREADGRAQFVDRAERIKDHIVLARQR